MMQMGRLAKSDLYALPHGTLLPQFSVAKRGRYLLERRGTSIPSTFSRKTIPDRQACPSI